MAVASRPRKAIRTKSEQINDACRYGGDAPRLGVAETHYQKLLKAVHLRHSWPDVVNGGEYGRIRKPPGSISTIPRTGSRMKTDTNAVEACSDDLDCRERSDGHVPRRQDPRSRRTALCFTSRCVTPRGSTIMHDGSNVVHEVNAVLDRMA